jgi:CheY-like chemotaxis protein
MPDGGALTLRTSVSDEASASAEELPLRRLHVEVVDTGAGMDSETRRRCLEPFFTTKGRRGTGLGLAMVYGTVQRHGAHIEIESEPGRGTTVRLTFDVPVAADTPLPTATHAHPRAERLRILVVDDDPLLLTSLRDALETDAHEVTSAAGGQAGIDLVRQSQEDHAPFDVVITDLGMPYVDGRQVARRVKEASPETPVILLTGWGQRLIDDGDVPADIDLVLSKPPRLSELRLALSELTLRTW